jgi:hypothetical protein
MSISAENRLKLTRNYLQIFRYFLGSSGSVEIWNNMMSLQVEDRDLRASSGAIARKYRYTQAETDVLFYAKSEARVLESNRMGGKRIENNSRLEDQLRKAALQVNLKFSWIILIYIFNLIVGNPNFFLPKIIYSIFSAVILPIIAL